MGPLLAFALVATACTTSPVGPGRGSIALVVGDTIDSQGIHTRGTSLQALFLVGEEAPAKPQQQIGPCQIQLPGDAGGGQHMDHASAGKIEIADGTRTLSITPNRDDTYPATFTPGGLFAGGVTLQLNVSGGGVPGFEASLVAASNVTITGPAKPSPTVLVDRARDLQLTWAGANVGFVQVSMEVIGVDVFLGGIACTFPASAGNGTIPAAALATLPKTAGYLGISSITPDVETDRDWTIQLFGSSEAVWPDGSSVQAPYMLQ